MSRASTAAAALALAALLLAGDLAGADPPAPSGAAAVQVGQAGTAQPDTRADQLSHPRTDATSAVQLPHARADATGAAQLGPAAGHPAAAPAEQIVHPAAGRDTRVGAIEGRDRCDPTSPEAGSPACARIPENRPDDFQTPPTDATANTVDPNAPSQDLVNGILSGGTGTVVQLPPK